MKKADETRLRVTFKPYDRYEDTEIITANVSGINRVDALCNMLDHMWMYLQAGEVIERKMTDVQIIESLEQQNGDGCDFIIKLEDITADEVLMYYPDLYEDEEEYW